MILDYSKRALSAACDLSAMQGLGVMAAVLADRDDPQRRNGCAAPVTGSSSRCATLVAMVQTADLWEGDNSAIRGLSLPRTRSGNIGDEAHRGSASRQANRAVELVDESACPCPGTDAFGIVVVGSIGFVDPAQVVLAQDHDVIQALPTDRADQPLRMPTLPR